MGTVGGLGILICMNGRGVAAHADLHMVVPMATAFGATIDLQQNFVRFDLDSRDLHLVAHSRGRTGFPHDVLPGVDIVRSVTVEYERLLGAGERNL
jgi:hypothetical protein